MSRRLPASGAARCRRIARASMEGIACALLVLGATTASRGDVPPQAPRLVPPPAEVSGRLVIDTHGDITQKIVYEKADFLAGIPGAHLDLPRARRGGLGAEFFSIFVFPKRTPRAHWFDEAEHQLLALRELAIRSRGQIALATSASDVRAAHARGALAMLFGVEGGHVLGPGDTEAEQLKRLERLHALGARYLTLTWTNTNDLGGSCGDEGDGQGLTPFGAKVIAEMERLGMMVDLSHVSDPLFWDAIRTVHRPVLLSHSSSRALANVPRNVTDAMARAVAKNGGAICVNFNPSFLDADYGKKQAPLWAAAKPLPIDESWRFMAAESRKLPPVPLAKLVDHILHLVEVAGIDHVCLGSDFDGVPSLPAGLDDAAALPKLVELLAKKLDEPALAKLLGENVLRVLAANEPSERPPAHAAGRPASPPMPPAAPPAVPPLARPASPPRERGATKP